VTSPLTVAAGFRLSTVDDLTMLVNDGPSNAAAGRFVADAPLSGALLWSRQVLRYGRLRAVVLNGPTDFDAVHAVAERAATALSVGAVEIAVRPREDGFVVLTTDAAVEWSTLDSTLDLLGVPPAGGVLLLASGVGRTRTETELAAELEGAR
jgi:glutamate N-acetyltransferase/amino-acid N-acetyltransferase